MIRQTQPAHWVSDKDVKACAACLDEFSVRKRKHHCRNCGQIFCADCTSRRLILSNLGLKKPSRTCESCYTRLTNDDKRQIVEDLDAQGLMIASLKRALHQKVLLLDQVKSILSHLVTSSKSYKVKFGFQKEQAFSEIEAAEAAEESSDSENEEEGESIEWHLKHLKEVFAELYRELDSALENQNRLLQIKNHLEEEAAHREVHFSKIKHQYQLELGVQASEIQGLRSQLENYEKIDKETDAETRIETTSPVANMGPISTRSRSICETVSDIICWPVQVVFDVLHPDQARSMSTSARSRALVVGDVETGEMRLDTPHTPCCRRRKSTSAIRPRVSILHDTLL